MLADFMAYQAEITAAENDADNSFMEDIADNGLGLPLRAAEGTVKEPIVRVRGKLIAACTIFDYELH